MIVVDTNIIAYLFIKGEFTHEAEKVLNKDAEWAAPLLWKSEMRNVLMLYLRKNLFTLHDAGRVMHEAESLMQNNAFQVPSLPVFQLAKESGCSSYDCEFVALAQMLDIPLITCDKNILNQFPSTAKSIHSFIQP